MHGYEDGPPLARVRRSQTLVTGSFFDFRVHCIFCIEQCVPMDTRHPDRWDRVRQCQTQERPGLPTFRDYLHSHHRNDPMGVRALRNIGEETDLPAQDAQYHERCMNTFKVIPKSVHISPNTCVDDVALKACIDVMYHHDQNRLYATTELYATYSAGGGTLSRKQMFCKLTDCLADEVVVIRCDGCASLVGFKAFVGSVIKLEKVSMDDDESEVESVIRQIRRGTKCNPIKQHLLRSR